MHVATFLNSLNEYKSLANKLFAMKYCKLLVYCQKWLDWQPAAQFLGAEVLKQWYEYGPLSCLVLWPQMGTLHTSGGVIKGLPNKDLDPRSSRTVLIQLVAFKNESNYLKHRDVPRAVDLCCWRMSPRAFVLMSLKYRLTFGVFQAKFAQEQFW
jgi:hypothetical protein